MSYRAIFCILMCCFVLFGIQASVRADGNDKKIADTKAELIKLLEECQKQMAQGGANTSPLEQCLIKMKDLKASDALLDIMKTNGCKEFEPMFVWVVCDIADPKAVEPLLAYLKNLRKEAKMECSQYLGNFVSDSVAKFLLDCAKESEIANQKKILMGACLASGEKKLLESIKEKLKGKDLDSKIIAIETIGLTHNPDFMEHLIPLFADKTALQTPVKSENFSITKRTETKSPEGKVVGFSESNEPREFNTVRELALEAANLLYVQNIPPMIGWWYDRIGGNGSAPFGFGDDVVKNILALVESEKTARSAKLKNSREALMKALYAEGAPEDVKCANLKITLQDGAKLKAVKGADSKTKYWVIELEYIKTDDNGVRKTIRRKIVLNGSTLEILDASEKEAK